MNTVTAVRNRILQLCEEQGITINGLATISGLPPSSIKNILYGKSLNPKIVTIKMICDGLNITLREFFSTSEFDGLEQEIK
ncbi:MAG: helix-turn-helix transcriptional regulator [Oscillospiraceae bacterium]|jgi:transcriptional regulator with XRE-family HTH domain|nr:helix-turn-helix transcriptional regulator [Oscillospiraceae bacterium]